MDIMLEVPALLEIVTELQSCSCSIMTEILQGQILSRCNSLERAMRVWAAKMGTDMLRFDYTFVGQPVPRPKQEAEFVLLHLSIVYWFIEMMLFSVKSFALKTPSLEVAEAKRQLEAAAKKSTRALPLLFDKSSGLSHNLTGLLALSIALRYFYVVEQSGDLSGEFAIFEDLLGRKLMGTTIEALLTRMYGGNHPSSIGSHINRLNEAANVVRWF
jgi:hypothetical protein